MVSMILRNMSFSDIDPDVLCGNYLFKRFISDLLWMVFTNSDKLISERRILNFKKDIVVLLSNIAHNYQLDSSVDVFLLLMLVLSFNEPRRVTSLGDSIFTYSEFPWDMGNYQAFGVDVLTKLFSLDAANKRCFKSVILRSLGSMGNNRGVDLHVMSPQADSADKKLSTEYKASDIDIDEEEDEYEDEEIVDDDIVQELIFRYSGNSRTKLLNDIVSYIISAIPFQQLSEQPTKFEEVSPVIAQSLICLNQVTKLVVQILSSSPIPSSQPSTSTPSSPSPTAGGCDGSEEIDITSTNLQELEISRLPLHWLLSVENVGAGLRQLFRACETFVSQKKDSELPTPVIDLIRSNSIRLLTRLLQMSSLDKGSCMRLIKVPGLIPSEEELFDSMNKCTSNPDTIRELSSLFHVRKRIYQCLEE